MAKSLRAKTRQSAGRKRRATGHYAVAEAARVQRLSDKLLGKTSAKGKGKEMRKDEDGDEVIADEGGEGEGDEAVEEDAVMAEGKSKICWAIYLDLVVCLSVHNDHLGRRLPGHLRDAVYVAYHQTSQKSPPQASAVPDENNGEPRKV